ncbi:peptidase S24-like protein [Rhodovulum steppense]|uniref:Peptidase S24-like protein n=1 Tax=Rhodovulum steppense TaxID=540251 RepID=A0A4R1YUP2_9RHOB|nr:peptidase S24-like protein [Rhodovulum steppense]
MKRLRERLDAGPWLSKSGGTSDARSNFIHLPLFDIHASAGLGMPVGPEVQLGALALDRAFLRAQGANPDRCSVIAASGDSMEPSIPNGALLVVDHGQTEIRHGHIMVVNVGEDLLVKRIRRRLDGLVELISDNPAYPPETIGRDMIDQLRIVGRVVYYCRTP